MTPLGKALVFYLRYATEVDYLTGGAEPSATFPGDVGEAIDGAHEVVEQANRDAVDFLTTAGPKIADTLRRIAEVEAPNLVARGWYYDVPVRAKSGRKLEPIHIYLGINDTHGEIRLTIFHGGGKAGEERARAVLGQRAVAQSADYDGDSGSVAIIRIPITAGRAEQFEVDRDPIIARLVAAIAHLTDRDVLELQKIRTGSRRAKL